MGDWGDEDYEQFLLCDHVLLRKSHAVGCTDQKAPNFDLDFFFAFVLDVVCGLACEQ